MKPFKKFLFDFSVMTLGCLLMMAGPLLQATGIIGG
jgi:hypothetical protein